MKQRAKKKNRPLMKKIEKAHRESKRAFSIDHFSHSFHTHMAHQAVLFLQLPSP